MFALDVNSKFKLHPYHNFTNRSLIYTQKMGAHTKICIFPLSIIIFACETIISNKSVRKLCYSHYERYPHFILPVEAHKKHHFIKVVAHSIQLNDANLVNEASLYRKRTSLLHISSIQYYDELKFITVFAGTSKNSSEN